MAKILIVDDSSFQRKKVKRLLEAKSHDVLVADNGELGLEMIVSHDPDWILLDVLMPNLDGFGFLQKKKEL